MNTAAVPLVSRMACTGCGAMGDVRYPFRCPNNADDDNVDHVLRRALNASAVKFPGAAEANPFVAFRTLLHSYHVGRASGMTDDGYVGIVRTLDEEIARIDGAGFRVTPFECQPALGAAAGLPDLWVKDETGNVSGSHKARHLMGIMIYLQVLDALGVSDTVRRPLAIASCGNAALAAAVVARAGGRPLDVFIPPDAPSRVVARLSELGARTIVCRRSAGEPGDPCVHAFRAGIAAGALPFCCQGPENGLTIEGGETLGWEIVTALGGQPLDAVVVQVGGGALASAVIAAFSEAFALGAAVRIPRLYTVQTEGAFPLKRAFDRVVERLGPPPFETARIERTLHDAATHRRSFMWPWETEPHSLARGILDDETYDWLAVVEGMLRTGGQPVVVDEATLASARDLARATTAIPVDYTGAAGLAGAMQLVRDHAIAPDERVAVIFSGRER